MSNQPDSPQSHAHHAETGDDQTPKSDIFCRQGNCDRSRRELSVLHLMYIRYIVLCRLLYVLLILMDDYITLGEAKRYYCDWLAGLEPEIKADRQHLFDKDLARGDDSLIRQFLPLQLTLHSQVSDALDNLPVEEALQRLGECVDSPSEQSGLCESKRSLGNTTMPLWEAIEIMKERLGIEPWSESLGLDESWKNSLDQEDTSWRQSKNVRRPDDFWDDHDYNQEPGGRGGR